MKATELMIMDWVYFKYSSPEKWQPRQWRICAYENDFIELANPKTSCKPIPLTPEILEKNGWKEAQFWHEYQDGKNTIQSCLPDMRGIINGVEIQHFKCEYVHQYQHLLRLCGLDDLANNIKIE